MDTSADIVVAGAGHNSLVAACYLAKAGYRCLVLDARHIPGGGAATEELLLPGFGIDTCATGHTLIRINPLLTRDELGLVADYGLRYIDPDPVAHVAFPDGEHFTMWLDRDRTAAEIARFSAADAASYLNMLAEYDEVKSIFSSSQFTPVGFGPSADSLLAEHPRGRVWQRRRVLSAWDIIRHEFSSRHVRAFMLWMAFQTNQAVDVPGSGSARLLADLRPAAAQLVDPGRRIRPAHGGPDRLSREPWRHGALRQARHPARDRRRALRRRRDRRRRAVPGRDRRAVHDPRHPAAGHGPGQRVAGGVPLRNRHLRSGRARLRRLPVHQRAPGVRDRERSGHRGLGRDRGLAGRRRAAGSGPAGRPVRVRGAVASGRHADAGGSRAGPRPGSTPSKC